MATTVPKKGGTGKFSIDKCLEFVEENGDRESDIIVKSDQEPAIEALLREVIAARPEGKSIPEESPKADSESNGLVERAVQEVEGIIRTLFLGLAERLGKKVSAKERIVTYIPEYAAYLLNRLSKGDDGKVPYERVKGKKPTIKGIEFGEKILFTDSKRGGKLNKINPKYNFGIFVGMRRRSGEVIVMTPEGKTTREL